MLALQAGAQTDYGYRLGRQERGEVRFNAQGPSVLMGAFDPTVMRWYMPQELFDEYGGAASGATPTTPPSRTGATSTATKRARISTTRTAS